MPIHKPHKLALVEWNYLIEDFLDNIGLTLEDYTQKMTGGWNDMVTPVANRFQ